MSFTSRFTGELMICVVCGSELRSHPEVETDWRCLELDEHIFYACPKEFPHNGSMAQDFKHAYELVLSCCLNEILKKKGKPEMPEVEKYQSLRWSEARSKSNSKGF